MYTRCSHCQASYRVNADQLRESRGFMTCIACGERFDALPSLVEDARQRKRQRSLARRRKPDLLYELQREYGVHYRPLAWAVGCVALLMMLSAQWLYFEGHILNEQASYYRTWQNLCRQLGCQPPLYRQLAEIELAQTQLSVAPDQTWLLTSLMTNQAVFSQSAPRLRLEVQDFNGHAIAERIFQPAEYGASELLSVKQSVPIQLRIAPLSSAIAGYHLSVL